MLVMEHPLIGVRGQRARGTAIAAQEIVGSQGGSGGVRKLRLQTQSVAEANPVKH